MCLINCLVDWFWVCVGFGCVLIVVVLFICLFILVLCLIKLFSTVCLLVFRLLVCLLIVCVLCYFGVFAIWCLGFALINSFDFCIVVIYYELLRCLGCAIDVVCSCFLV